MSSGKSNLVVIMADQLRWDALGEHTPHINALKAESVVFERAYCASPLCVPARGSFFTGKYPNVTGSLINPWTEQEKQHGMVCPEHTNLYELLEHEWDSWHTGKQHLFTEPKLEHSEDSRTHWLQLEQRYEAFMKESGKKKPGGPAFQGLVPELAYGKITRKRKYSIPTVARFDEALDYFYDGFILNDSLEAIRQRDRSKPFALNAMFLAPHPPLHIPEPWFSLIGDAKLPDNVGVWGVNQSPLQLYNLTGMLGSSYTREEWQRIWNVYMGLVALLDHCVGKLIAELKSEGLYDDTLIMFCSDHGEMLGSHKLWQKMCMYEESVKTPLMMKFPSGFEPAVRSVSAPVSSVDVLPTLCESLGLTMPEGVSGESLMPLIRGEKAAPEREQVFIQFDGNGARSNFQRCVIEGSDKLIVDIFKDEMFIELYDLAEDPQEMNNLAFREEEHGSRIERMLASLREHMQATNDLLTLPANGYRQFLNDYGPFQDK
ncbi:Choline-sulfatase [Paenibacillus solanacearum]|uniref:Choline-sulfatase n=1 Tax=Paenibacillus solanacearum TaxID=2048548 RepID=A0A916K3K6_9BACL|nr:sulfatase-like hydrolase/transferase [Paenibacillus solanacearum]CAG7632781.1 Choline-sulfatase [Paenibacillus solanacearum]